jgi:hypothetical protein
MPNIPNIENFKGKKFGKLTAFKFSHFRKSNRNTLQYWIFKCDCGNKTTKSRQNIQKSNGTTSCGCDFKQKARIAHMKHGFFGTPIYNIWTHMIARCHYEFNDSYERYGARGIIVCDRWRESFTNFYSDMGDRPTSKHSIDRIDVNGDYCKENCRWATQKQQSNNKTNNFHVEYRGKIYTISQLSEKYLIDRKVLRNRIIRGWNIKEALFTPVRKITK